MHERCTEPCCICSKCATQHVVILCVSVREAEPLPDTAINIKTEFHMSTRSGLACPLAGSASTFLNSCRFLVQKTHDLESEQNRTEKNNPKLVGRDWQKQRV